MPKATKERTKHNASLAAQLQNERDNLLSKSGRAKRKAKAGDVEDVGSGGEHIVGGKFGRQILTMARQQQEEVELENEEHEEDGSDDEMKWRENQLYGLGFLG